MAHQPADDVLNVRVPNKNVVVESGGGQNSVVGTVVNVHDALGVAEQRFLVLLSVEVPEADFRVHAAAHQRVQGRYAV